MSAAGPVAVLGLGLIGGSIARDLRALGVEVSGWDADAAALGQAAEEGVVAPLEPELRELRDADLVILAVPGDAARRMLPVVAARSATAVVTDTGSTKRAIMAAARDAGLTGRFVGSHPLAGSERSGWSASRQGLFAGARVFVTRPPDAAPAAVLRVTELWRSLGARPETVSPADHDRAMAWASHAPQAVSTALGLALAGAGLPRSELGPGGLDVTRLAGSDPEIWASVFADNSDEVARALRDVAAGLAILTDAIESGDIAAVTRVMNDARAWYAESRPS